MKDMEQEFTEQFYQLFESEKYISQLNNETIDIDLNDLPEEINEVTFSRIGLNKKQCL